MDDVQVTGEKKYDILGTIRRGVPWLASTTRSCNGGLMAQGVSVASSRSARAYLLKDSILRGNTFPSFLPSFLPSNHPSNHPSGSTNSSSTIETILLFSRREKTSVCFKSIVAGCCRSVPHCLGRDARGYRLYYLSESAVNARKGGNLAPSYSRKHSHSTIDWDPNSILIILIFY
ncbi:hypothetical protein V1477_019541 [Vespula maculifrons]|uniref:Uncharacterized protein n=1 Tax=Vespula maculifrons TaxID=7453 RepID=A0ABD2AST0_VESMC